jgi:hypothetical protein
VDDAWIQSPFVFCLFYPEGTCLAALRMHTSPVSWKKKPSPDDKAAKLTGFGNQLA